MSVFQHGSSNPVISKNCLMGVCGYNCHSKGMVLTIQYPSEYRTSLVFKWLICVRLSNGPVFKCWSENWTECSLLVVQNVRYSNGPPSHVTTILIPDTHDFQFSDEFGILVFGIQMVTVYVTSLSIFKL